jgi:hypothetical protein
MNGGSSKTTRSKAGRRTNQCSEPSNFSSTILGLLLIIFAAWIRDLCILRSMLDMLSTVELESLIGIVPSEWSERTVGMFVKQSKRSKYGIAIITSIQS